MKSKRNGFIEFTGSLVGISDKARVTIVSYSDGSAPMLIRLLTDEFICLIRPQERKAWIAEAAHHWIINEYDYEAPLQSRLTHQVVRQLLESGSCGLTPYSVSAQLHLPLINALLQKYKSIVAKKVNKCPIT
ncbi:hypothetical protein D3C80_1441100 [compost metagenome]